MDTGRLDDLLRTPGPARGHAMVRVGELPEQRMIYGFRIVTPDHGGLFIDGVAVGAEVAEGDVLARIIDPFGDLVEELTSPAAGVVLTVPVNPAVGTGTWAYEIGW